MNYINKNFDIPKSLNFLIATQENGDMIFIATTNSLIVSYGDTEKDLATLKKVIIAIYIADNKTLYHCEKHCTRDILDCIENGYGQQVAAVSKDISNQIELYFSTTNCDCCTCDIEDGFEKCSPPCCNCIKK